MAFDWADYLTLADILIQKGQGVPPLEAAQRTAVSRAYYALFCTIRNYAVSHLQFQPLYDSRDHQRLRQHLQSQGAPWIRVASVLDRLRKWRNQCDYEDVVSGLSNMAIQSVQDARQALQGVI